MKITSITLKNFRCFGPEPAIISLEGLTTLVGANGAGKTAVLHSLTRMFSTLPSERRLTKDDFHFGVGHTAAETHSVEMFVEVQLAFPELTSSSEILIGVPECFKHMVVAEEGGDPFCRVRLEAVWRHTVADDGDIEEVMYWVTRPVGDPTDEDKHQMRPYERRRIHALYVPATRDPSTQLKNIAGTMLARVVRAINWSVESEAVVTAASKRVEEAFLGEAGVKMFHDAIKINWKGLHDALTYATPQMSFLGSGVEEVLRQVGMVFEPSEAGDKHNVDRLSDGQRSLFYLAFVATMCDIEQQVIAQATQQTTDEEGMEVLLPPMDPQRLAPPMLTLLAIEEPENHLAPHYLSRVMAMLNRIAECSGVQVILTSHSPAILGRVDPTWIRHFRLEQSTGCAIVKTIRLPEQADEAFKYVKEAVRAYPEMYFARFVILGEGDSEEIVIPRVANCHGMPIDMGFISVVPLGGRHVGHFWRLLTDLAIPYVTLLDLDRERDGGGWGRIKYACNELVKTGVDKQTVLGLGAAAESPAITDAELEAMHTRDRLDGDGMAKWLDGLENVRVYFSAPLDLDLLMLQALPDAYMGLAPALGGPRIPDEEPMRTERIKKASLAVLGGVGHAETAYAVGAQELFPWYSYLFLGKGKPSTHLCALASVEDADLTSKVPPVLARLISRVKSELAQSEVN